MMSKTNSKERVKQTVQNSRATTKQPKNREQKRKLSCSSIEEGETLNVRKKQKRDTLNSNYFYKSLRYVPDNSNCGSQLNDRLVIEERLILSGVEPPELSLWKNTENDFHECLNPSQNESKCWINDLPEEILLKIFSYLPLGMLLHTISQISKKWEVLALDWTLWKTVEDLKIKNMVISTDKLKTLLRTIPRLKKLELILRNDTEELLHVVFETHKNLEVVKLDRCCRSTLQMNMRSQTVSSILESCPKLKTVILNDTYFHSISFYKCLAKKFSSIERVNITCTSKSEMNIFVESLKENVPEAEFQRVPMMGRAAGKQIYWGPILGLVVRPIPTSPFHQRYIHDGYPNYAF